MNQQPEFEHLGYFKDYIVNGKSIGNLPCEKDRDEIGYHGRKTEILTETIIFPNKKKLKAGTEVMTMIYPLCGRIIKPN